MADEEQVEQVEGVDAEPSVESKTLGEMDGILTEKEPVESPTVPEEESEPIPSEQVEAGYAAGLTEEVIVQLAETNPAVLKALAEFRSRAKEPASVEEISEEKVEGPTVLEYVKSPELDFKDEKVKDLFAGLVGNQNRLIDQLNQVNQVLHENKMTVLQTQKAESEKFDAFVDNYLDAKVKDCPAIGLSRSLGGEQLQTRQGIFAIAKVLSKGTWEERLGTALKMWNVQGSGDEAERKLAAKLDGQKKKFSPRPGGQKSTKDTRTAQERAMVEFDEIAEKHGAKFGE
jgi:hypothetical protein